MDDFGTGLVVASLGAGGDWLSLGAPHARHGFVELNGLPPFEPAWRGDPDATRRYRGWMGDDAFAFLTVDGSVAVDTEAVVDEPRIVQRRRIAGETRVHFRGRLDAHALAEITETDPPAPSGARTRLHADGERLVVEAAELPARAEIVVRGESTGWSVGGDSAQLVATGPELVIACSLETDTPAPREPRAPAVAPATVGVSPLHVPEEQRAALDALAGRSLAYVRDCTAMRVGERELCLLTDHRILPLSWTRDAYWQAALLLGAGEAGLVADHLRWLWARCERPEALWSRSHHPHGAAKDRALQADQQLYPLLELAAYRRVTGALPDPPGEDWWMKRVDELWDALPAGEDGLLSSEENPADDRSELPYPLSAQLLHWRTAMELGCDAGAIRERVARHFVVDGPFGPQWAYEVDAHGGHRLYQDANDLPTAFAPLDGFCAAADPVWTATMRFAFSEHNPAHGAGLGSMHTPGTWTLGDLQEWVVASLTGDTPRASRALARLLAVAGDGLLPEAYDAATYGNPVRRWFAWPGAALGALIGAPAQRG